MKKLFTLFAVVALMGSAVMAQRGAISNSVGESVWSTSTSQATAKVDTKAASRIASKGAKMVNFPIWEDTMSYCLNGEYVSSVGTNGVQNDTVSWAIRIPAMALEGRNNLTSVEFFLGHDCAGTYTVKVVSGAQPTGAAQFTQTVTVTAADSLTWKHFDLSTPMPIDASVDLWVIVSNSDLNYPAAGCAGNGYADGQWIYFGNNWYVLSEQTNLDYTWMIRAISDTYDVLPPRVEIMGPATVRLNDTVVYIASSPNSDGYEWYVDGIANTTNNDTLSVAFDADGMHQVVVAATNTVGTTYDTVSVNVLDCSSPISVFPSYHTFEAGEGCWDFISAHPSNDDRVGPFSMNYNGTNLTVFRFSSYASAADYNQFLISPELDLSSEDSVVMYITYMGDRSNDAFRIRASSTTRDTAAFTTVLKDYPQVNNEHFVTDAVVLPANTKYVAINYYANYRYYLYLASVAFDAYSAPIMSVDGPDSLGNGVAATYTTVCLLADSIAWEVDGVEMSVNGDTLHHTFTTTGDHTVVATGYNALGSTSDTLNVLVYSCEDIELPYTASFKYGLGCWSSRSDLTEEFGWYASATDDSQVFSVSAEQTLMGGLADVPVDNWLFSPVLSIPADERYEVAWSVKPDDPSYASDHYGLYSISSTGDTTLLFEETLNSSMTAFEPRIVALPTDAGAVTLAFRHFNSMGGRAIFLDNIQVRPLTAPLVHIKGLKNVETNTNVTFTAVCGNADSYDWTVDGTPVNTMGNVISTSFTTMGSHTVVVTANNTVGSTQDTLTLTAFVCNAISEFPYTQDFEDTNTLLCWRFIDADSDGFNWDYNYRRNSTDQYDNPYGHNRSYGLVGSASWNNGHVLSPDNWMILPAMELPADQNLILSWYEKGIDEEYFAEHYSVYISTTGREVSDFTTATVSYTANPRWVGRNIDLAQYAGQTIYVAFRHHDITDMYYLAIDDIRVSTERVGIDEVASSRVALYPNPATSVVTLDGLVNGAQVNIVDLNGRTVRAFTAKGSTVTIDVADMAKGAYFVRVCSAENTSVNKLIVK